MTSCLLEFLNCDLQDEKALFNKQTIIIIKSKFVSMSISIIMYLIYLITYYIKALLRFQNKDDILSFFLCFFFNFKTWFYEHKCSYCFGDIAYFYDFETLCAIDVTTLFTLYQDKKVIETRIILNVSIDRVALLN